MRPEGADNFLKWRRSITEHLELRRMTFLEYALFNWLCTKANPWSGTVRTSWPTLAEQTGLSANHVEILCRSLRRKRYIWYPRHQGQRRRLVEVAIDKFPLPGETYTDLSAGFGRRQTTPVPDMASELGSRTPPDLTDGYRVPDRRAGRRPMEVSTEDPTEVPTEVGVYRVDNSGTYIRSRTRKRTR